MQHKRIRSSDVLENDSCMNCFDITSARAVFAKGGNVTQFLKNAAGCSHNSAEIIEIAYDLQAGSYINRVSRNIDREQQYADELASLIAPFLSSGKTLLDVGAGELTTLAQLMTNTSIQPTAVYAFDISWSRLHHGRSFCHETLGEKASVIHPFVANIRDIPLPGNSIDVVTSNHALEPNGGNLSPLLNELFRVCREYLVLFEPSYELNSAQGKARMDKLGYIKDIEGTVRHLGGVLQDVIPHSNVWNPLNPTTCYIIEPPENDADTNLDEKAHVGFTAPGTDYYLHQQDGFWVSRDAGLAFPVLQDIPILKSGNAILATSLF